jgi:glycosyltransferase involved in cell wall biosynthesis
VRVAFYPSFRSLDHPNASGLVSIARDVLAALKDEGLEAFVPVHRSMEWIYLRPSAWPGTLAEVWRAGSALRRERPDCWLTYHSYFRGPDIVGPLLSSVLDIPYFILEGSYATKYRKRLKTWAGFHLNRMALKRADTVFVNKSRDVTNLGRLLPSDRISYVRPGIRTGFFPPAPEAGMHRRAELGLQDRKVIVTAAMMRPGVKEDGFAFVIDVCASLMPEMPDLHLLILGDGPGRERLKTQAERLLPGAHTFAGRIEPQDMHVWYQAADVFAFPGIGEAIGMVYLEAQCCGLPVVATSHDGAPEVVADGETGLIVPPFSVPAFAKALSTLLHDVNLRSHLGRQARERVLSMYDTQANYRFMFETMRNVCARRRP